MCIVHKCHCSLPYIAYESLHQDGLLLGHGALINFALVLKCSSHWIQDQVVGAGVWSQEIRQ